MESRVFAFSAFSDLFAYFALSTKYVLAQSGSTFEILELQLRYQSNIGQGRDKLECKNLQDQLKRERLICLLDFIRSSLWDWSSLLSSLLAVRTCQHSSWFRVFLSVPPFSNVPDEVRVKELWYQFTLQKCCLLFLSFVDSSWSFTPLLEFSYLEGHFTG